jgi:hypothetical protein
MRSVFMFIPRGDIMAEDTADRATGFSDDSRLITAGEASQQVPGVESILRKRCRAHIRSLGPIKKEKIKRNNKLRIPFMLIPSDTKNKQTKDRFDVFLNGILKEPLR